MEDEQKLTEQQRTALSQLEDLRSELHSMVDARVDGSIQHSDRQSSGTGFTNTSFDRKSVCIQGREAGEYSVPRRTGG